MQTTTTYRDAFRLPHAARAFVPSIIGKMSFAMVSLALLLLVHSSSGSYGLSGAVAGGFGLANVVAAPLRARLVDRYGARSVLPWLGIGYAAGLICIAVATSSSVTGAIIVPLGIVTGLCTPPLGAVMRGVWALLSPTDALRTRAYSLDAVAEELVFIAGPLLVGLLVLLPNGPVVAVFVSAAAGLGGTLGLVAAPVAAPGGSAHRGSGWRAWVGPLRHARLWPVLLTLVAIGLVLGAIELLSTAHAGALGDAGLAGVLLACFGVGSAVGGLAYGARDWASSPVRRMLILASTACAGLLIAAWTSSLAALIPVFALVGLFIAPSLVTGYLVADEIAPLEERTEASALINTAVNAGAAGALAIGGALLDGVTVTIATIAVVAVAGGCIVAAMIVVTLTNGRHP